MTGRPRTKDAALAARAKLTATARAARAQHVAEVSERLPAAAALAAWLRTRPDRHARADALMLLGRALADVDGLDMPLPGTPEADADTFLALRDALSSEPPAHPTPKPTTQGAKPAMLTITITSPEDVPVLFATLRQMLATATPAVGPFASPVAPEAPEAPGAAENPIDVVVKRGPGRPRKTAAEQPPAPPVQEDEQAPAPVVEAAPEPQPVVEEPKAAPAATITYDELKAVCGAFAGHAEKGGAARFRALLTEFGVARISELPEARWAEMAGRVRL